MAELINVVDHKTNMTQVSVNRM